MPERLPERRRRRRPDLRKLMIVLPSLFTVSSIFCGVYSIMLSSGEASGDNFYRAAVAIFFGNFFDAFDGRVARMTRTQSEFGVELDSLADVITFGVAPAILVYKWALYELGFLGMAIAAVYAACGAIRLARFNVLARSPWCAGTRTDAPCCCSSKPPSTACSDWRRMCSTAASGEPLPGHERGQPPRRVRVASPTSPSCRRRSSAWAWRVRQRQRPPV